MAELGFPDSHLVINFRGVEIPIAPTALEFDGDPNYVVDIGDTTTMGTAWTNFFAGPQSITSTFESIHASGALTKGLPDTTADYGLMPVGTPTSCVSTGDCPVLTAGGTKVLGADEDLFVAETLLLPPLAPEQGAFPDKIWEVHVGGSFGDVPTGNIFYAFIENIFHNSVTGGCGAGNYCPTNATLRKQMAVFLLKAFEGAGYVPPPATGVFDDVPAADPFAPWIEELAAAGSRAAATPTSYCPDNPVTAQADGGLPPEDAPELEPTCHPRRPASSTTCPPTGSGRSSRTSTTAASPEAAPAGRRPRPSPTARTTP